MATQALKPQRCYSRRHSHITLAIRTSSDGRGSTLLLPAGCAKPTKKSGQNPPQ
ncbi:hypothetical protein LSCM4_03735 [Leishmania orientalis]|uniref:Uncharacterized protein n=1 Tax=Leishmania orientalis TaxID=2249476 RepID=A0A836KIX8_9TRYP|nr:hypothetical protein LSCM4_03735 [Leishmania orientalis]